MKRIDSPTPVQLSRGRTNQGRKKKKKRENICDLRTYLRKKAFLKVTAFNPLLKIRNKIKGCQPCKIMNKRKQTGNKVNKNPYYIAESASEQNEANPSF